MADDFNSKPEAEKERSRAKLYDGNQAEPRTPAAAKTVLHTHSVAESAARQHDTDLMHQLGMNAPAREAIYRDARDLEKVVPSELAATVIIGHIDNLRAVARISDDPDVDDVALAQRVKRDEVESRELITSQYGKRDGEELLRRAKAWTLTQPALAKMLRERGLGSRPDIVQQIVAHVFSNGLGR